MTIGSVALGDDNPEWYNEPIVLPLASPCSHSNLLGLTLLLDDPRVKSGGCR